MSLGRGWPVGSIELLGARGRPTSGAVDVNKEDKANCGGSAKDEREHWPGLGLVCQGGSKGC